MVTLIYPLWFVRTRLSQGSSFSDSYGQVVVVSYWDTESLIMLRGYTNVCSSWLVMHRVANVICRLS